MPRSETSTTVLEQSSVRGAHVMFFYVYVLQSIKHGKLYFGYTENLKKLLEEHNRGAVRSTKPYLPWKLIYYEACLNEQDARRREHYLKTTQGQRLMKRRLKEYFLS